jgi:hypothetical protein
LRDQGRDGLLWLGSLDVSEVVVVDRNLGFWLSNVGRWSGILGSHVNDGQKGTVLGNIDTTEVVLKLSEVDLREVSVDGALTS